MVKHNSGLKRMYPRVEIFMCIMQSICNHFIYTTKNKEFKMFPSLHKIIETKPSNNTTYEGGLGIYNTSKHSTSSDFNKIGLYKQIKDK